MLTCKARKTPAVTILKIKIALLKHNISQAAIARGLGITRVQVNQVIHGRLRTPYVREAIARACGLPVEEVFPDDVSMITPYRDQYEQKTPKTEPPFAKEIPVSGV